ncbi:MAG: hypothetical protein ACRDOL_38725 [Streptosporangiaceae bacterium]
MSDPADLRRITLDGTTWIFAGPVALFSYPGADAGMRNVAVVTLRQLGYGGQDVAGLMGLSENYVATLRNRALREASWLRPPAGTGTGSGSPTWRCCRRPAPASPSAPPRWSSSST